MKEKYSVIYESESAHCCFEATVIETETGKNICETFYPEHAEMIAAALNRTEVAH